MTSNIGSESIQEFFERYKDFENRYDEIASEVFKHLSNFFKPEFLNRVDDIVVFHPLGENHLKEIAKILLEEFKNRLKENFIEIDFDESVINEIIKVGFDPKFGARPMKRAIQKIIENKVAEAILKGKIVKNSKVIATFVDGELKFDVKLG
jgi:ATP-dependent Clp protease ATP-binding subunit ClpB